METKKKTLQSAGLAATP